MWLVAIVLDNVAIDNLKCFNDKHSSGNQVSISSALKALVFLYKSSFKATYEKCTRKTLMKLTPGLNFINVLCTAFTPADPKSIKRY